MNGEAPWGGSNQLYLQALQNIVQAINALIAPLAAVVNRISGLSVLGNSGTATAVAAPIIGTANQVLRVNGAGTALGFGPVAYAGIQNEAADTLLGNPTGGSAPPSEITLGATLAFVSAVLETIALSGDVTTSANSFATTIANGVVTLAKMANLAANSVIGNNTASAATPIALMQAQLTAMINNFTSSLAGDVPASGGGNHHAHGWRRCRRGCGHYCSRANPVRHRWRWRHSKQWRL